MRTSEGCDEREAARLIGCCGAFCGTCRALALGHCRGCKLGYDEGERNLAKARCKVKICCFGARKLETCADCDEYAACDTLGAFYAGKGYPGTKYRDSTEFVRANGYAEFVRNAKAWKGPYGDLVHRPGRKVRRQR